MAGGEPARGQAASLELPDAQGHVEAPAHEVDDLVREMDIHADARVRLRERLEERAQAATPEIGRRGDAQTAPQRALPAHVFFAAYQDRPTWAELVPPNLAMLVNVVEAIEPVASGLQHISLMQGYKVYGAHLGPFKTPARETDAPHMPPEFNVDQQAFLEARQKGKAWSRSAIRPSVRCSGGSSRTSAGARSSLEPGAAHSRHPLRARSYALSHRFDSTFRLSFSQSSSLHRSSPANAAACWRARMLTCASSTARRSRFASFSISTEARPRRSRSR
uniref:Uncharacterized protein n=1 Tax=Sorangium cellulosum TaxID=56 RepID=A0A3S5GYC4_SORCE|nr:hypothetical protein [Sorangium cellulosum]